MVLTPATPTSADIRPQSLAQHPATGAAFPGLNPAVGLGDFILPTGQSGYDALQIVFKQVKRIPHLVWITPTSRSPTTCPELSGMCRRSGNTGNSGDNFFNSPPYDYDNPSGYIGRLGLDHKHELSFGGSLLFKYGPQLGLVGHFFSALPTTLNLDNTAGATAQIFQTDVTGDGTVADLVPGTRPGAYMHDYKANTLQSLITNYNSRYANTLTPAGQALVNAGLFTSNATRGYPGSAAAHRQHSWRPRHQQPRIPCHRYESLLPDQAQSVVAPREHEPRACNSLLQRHELLELWNRFRTTADPDHYVVHSVWQASSTVRILQQLRTANRTQRGSGTFDQGGPRSIEYQLKFNF